MRLYSTARLYIYRGLDRSICLLIKSELLRKDRGRGVNDLVSLDDFGAIYFVVPDTLEWKKGSW